MLWQKETIKGELVYAKLLNKIEQKSFSLAFSAKLKTFVLPHALLRKDDFVSRESRKNGNHLFASGQFEEAINVYNKTLVITKNNSEDLGICYANRAACFLQLKRYKLCLADIELAKKNKYPTRLMPKLDRRKTECEKLLAAHGDADSQRAGPKLSFDADRKVPCFADGLEVKFSDKYGNHIVTNRDLEIGQTVIVERPIFFGNLSEYSEYCENCLERCANLIPCKNCVVAMFCSEKCRDTANERFHDVLCKTENFCGEPLQQLLFQSIVIAIKTFSTAVALMAAIEKFRAQNEISFTDAAKRDYFQFFKLRTNVDKLSARERDDIKLKAMEVVEVIKTRSSIQSTFRSTKMEQFLSHLAVHHMQILTFSAYEASHIVWPAYQNVLGIDRSASEKLYGIGLVPYSSQMNHSCAPNVCRIIINDTVVYKVLRPIKSGEQLFISYLDTLQLMQPRIKRAIEIATQYHFVCDCISCTSNWPPFKATGKQMLDVLSCRLLAVLDDVPAKDDTKLMPATREELRMFEGAAVNYLRKNDHLHPTMESLKMEFLLTQIWYVLMR